jgi:hypothetical protein
MWPFNKPKQTAPPTPVQRPSLEELSYDIAYHLLPQYAFNELHKAVEMWTKSPCIAGPFFYVMVCDLQKVAPDMNVAVQFRSRHGVLPGVGRYYLLEHAKPAGIDLSDHDPLEMAERGERYVLAPYFSIIVQQADPGNVMYFVLGQSPMGGGTTLRRITPKGANLNLGPGPSPSAENFLRAVERACRGRPAAGKI